MVVDFSLSKTKEVVTNTNSNTNRQPKPVTNVTVIASEGVISFVSQACVVPCTTG